MNNKKRSCYSENPKGFRSSVPGTGIKDQMHFLLYQDHQEIQLCLFHRVGLRKFIFLVDLSTSLVVQWIGICLLMQGTPVWSLVWGDSTFCRATKPVYYNHWSQCTAKTSSPGLLQLEKAHVQQWRPSTTTTTTRIWKYSFSQKLIMYIPSLLLCSLWLLKKKIVDWPYRGFRCIGKKHASKEVQWDDTDTHLW